MVVVFSPFPVVVFFLAVVLSISVTFITEHIQDDKDGWKLLVIVCVPKETVHYMEEFWCRIICIHCVCVCVCVCVCMSVYTVCAFTCVCMRACVFFFLFFLSYKFRHDY